MGVFGGLTAIVTNTLKESKRDGFTVEFFMKVFFFLNFASSWYFVVLQGAIRGITTGAVDTVTKPVQGIFDLVEGTASAMKEIVGGPAG